MNIANLLPRTYRVLNATQASYLYEVAYPQRVIRSTSCLVLVYVFLGRPSAWRYFIIFGWTEYNRNIGDKKAVLSQR